MESTRNIKEMDDIRNDMENEVRKATPRKWMWTSIFARSKGHTHA